jgi:hypothetical protein
MVFITSGWSLNGRYYSSEILRQALHLFERAPISLYGYEQNQREHVPTQYRDAAPGLVANIAGWGVNVREGEENGKFAVLADFECVSEHVRSLLLRATEMGGPIPFGISIDGIGQSREGVAEGRRGAIVIAIDHIYEGTIVDRPAAGGKITRLIASENYERRYNVNPNKKRLITFLLKFGHKAGVAPAAVGSFTESELAGASAKVLLEMDPSQPMIEVAMDFIGEGKTEEALKVLAKLASTRAPAEEVTDETVAVGPPVTESIAESETARANREARLETAAIRLDRMLENSKLPDKAAALVRSRFENRLFEAAELQQEIDNVRAVIAEHSPVSGPVQEAGVSVSITHDQGDKWMQEGELLFGYDPVRDSSLTEAQKQQYRNLGQVYSVKSWFERGRGALSEAVSGDLPLILSNAMNKVMLQYFEDSPRHFEDIIYIQPGVTDFKEQQGLLMHGYSGLPIVPEDTQYPNLGFPGEAKRGYNVDTRGGLAVITRKMIKNDDLRAFQDIPRRIGQGARHEENLFRGRMVTGQLGGGAINTDTSWTNLVLYHASHGNLRTAALSKAEIFLSRLDMINQKEFANTTTTGADITDSATSLTVASTKGLFVGALLLIESEVVRVTAVGSATALTITRAYDGTTAAAHTSGAVVRQLGRPIPARATHLYFPSELEDVAFTALNSVQLPGSANNDANFINVKAKEGQIIPHSVHRVYLNSDSNNWFLGNDKRDHASLRMGYLDGKEEPEFILEEGPTDYDMFNFDRIVWKVRHEYGGVQDDHRGLHANLVSGGT